VVVLSADQALAAAISRMAGPDASTRRYLSPAELDDWAHPPVDVVVLDDQQRSRGVLYRQLRQRYRGAVIVVLRPDEAEDVLPPDPARVIMRRPFRNEHMEHALTLAASISEEVRARAEAEAEAKAAGEEARTGADEGADAAPDAGALAPRSWNQPTGPRVVGGAIIMALAGITLALALAKPTTCGPGRACTGNGTGNGAIVVGGPALALPPIDSRPPSPPPGTGSTSATGGPGPVAPIGGVVHITPTSRPQGGTTPPPTIAPPPGTSPPGSPPPTPTSGPPNSAPPTDTQPPPTDTQPPPTATSEPPTSNPATTA